MKHTIHIYIPTEFEKDDRSMPPDATAPPTNVVHLMPILSVIIPATGENKNVDPIAREPTSAENKETYFHSILINVTTFTAYQAGCFED
jgi:hypothetical protein